MFDETYVYILLSFILASGGGGGGGFLCIFDNL